MSIGIIKELLFWLKSIFNAQKNTEKDKDDIQYIIGTFNANFLDTLKRKGYLYTEISEQILNELVIEFDMQESLKQELPGIHKELVKYSELKRDIDYHNKLIKWKIPLYLLIIVLIFLFLYMAAYSLICILQAKD